MKIETKLTLKNMNKNKKRTIFTIISIALCTFLILTTLIVISSITNSITENIITEYNDYHFIIKGLKLNQFNKIKDKDYIEKIYIQKNGEDQLKKLENTYIYCDSEEETINVYLKYNKVRKTYEYSTDIIYSLNFTEIDAIEKCEFNEKLLTIYGLIDSRLTNLDPARTIPVYTCRVNFSYVLDIMIIIILLVFSIFFYIILYNTFLITINERKKEYAILNSVGGTESQILKMTFLEATIMGIIGIIFGMLISILGANIILKMLNAILASTIYKFRLIIDIKYLIISLLVVMFNIYISAVIPSVKASTTSVIQNIRNNKQIKHKKRNNILEKILPIEGKMAIRNLKRNKNKYRVITVLLVICMTSYIAVTTYINYEKEAADLVNIHDIDAQFTFDDSKDYEYMISLFNDYTDKSGEKIEYIEYKLLNPSVLVEPEDSLTSDVFNAQLVPTFNDNKKSIDINLIGLDDKTYNKYMKNLNCNYGKHIIYNTVRRSLLEENDVAKYYSVFEKGDTLKLSIIDIIFEWDKEAKDLKITKYELIDDKNLNGNFVLTDEIVEGFKEIKNKNYYIPTIFVNMHTYDKIIDKFYEYISKNDIEMYCESNNYIKVKCNDIIRFSNYIEDIKQKENLDFSSSYYSLENKEKIIYINILQLILKVIISAVIIIGITSSINIINASLCEREEEFKALNRLGATKSNINRILIYESIYMFARSMIISIVLSAPIVYTIIKKMEKVIILNKILVPFGNIAMFFGLLLGVSLLITLYSTRYVKEK